MDRPATVGELRASGWAPRSVKDELRDNLLERMASGEPLFPGIIGFDDTVLPSLERALLAGHDIVLLGERGQAKTRLIRGLVGLLDEWMPAIADCELNDLPDEPICAACQRRLAEDGDEVPIVWVNRRDRYQEKLATPDTAVADLIGDVDPIRVAEGRYLADTETIHYGLVPRTHRGIFSINELPDLPARIQVSLLNVLEERDIQVRGYTIRLPLDLLLVATANPEDYTNRGRIITPLKDRFGSEIRTHYPQSVDDEIAIMRQEAQLPDVGVAVTVPDYFEDLLAVLTADTRVSPHINPRSGVSVRFSIANLETVVASAVRRAVRLGESEAVPRVADLGSILQSSMGRVEFDVFDEGRESDILLRLAGKALLEVFNDVLGDIRFDTMLDSFDDGLEVESGDLVSSESLIAATTGLELTPVLQRLGVDGESPAQTAAAIEFLLEGLHLRRRLNKDPVSGGARYRAA